MKHPHRLLNTTCILGLSRLPFVSEPSAAPCAILRSHTLLIVTIQNVYDPTPACGTPEEVTKIPQNDATRRGLSLRQHLGRQYLGLFDIHVGNVVSTSIVRPLSTRALVTLKTPIRDLGFVPLRVCTVSLKNKETVTNATSGERLAAEATETMKYAVVDGNHRPNTARRVRGPGTKIPCHVYMQFNAQEKRIIANGGYCIFV